MVTCWKSAFKSKWVWIAFVSLVVLVVGVPILINELYKQDKGYITVWGGEDVLSYYGTILGAAVTIIALYFTIKTTRAQIISERYISAEREKWGQIECCFRSAISLAQPLTLFSVYTAGLSKRPVEGCAELKKHMYDVSAAIDDVIGTVESSDETQVRDLMKKLKKIVQKEEKYANQYFDLLMLFNAARENNVEDSAAGTMAILLAQQNEISNNIEKLHKKDYQELLSIKNKCFSEIYRKINEEAKNILYRNV